MRVITKNMLRVYNNKEIASLFLPSKYQITGLPNIKIPVNAAEKTKSISIAIGINIVLLSPFPKNPLPRR